jgi:hypothetical protein
MTVHLIGRHEVYTCALPPVGAALPVDRVDAPGPQVPGVASRASGKRRSLPARALFSSLLWGVFAGMVAFFALGLVVPAFVCLGLFLLLAWISRFGG